MKPCSPFPSGTESQTHFIIERETGKVVGTFSSFEECYAAFYKISTPSDFVMSLEGN